MRAGRFRQVKEWKKNRPTGTADWTAVFKQHMGEMNT